MGKKFNQFLRQAAAAGINVGDINQASALFTGQAPAPPVLEPLAPPAPPAPVQAPLDVTTERSRLQVGSSASRKRRARQPRAKRQLSLGLSSGASTGSGTGGISF
jgi:hypothetical protein